MQLELNEFERQLKALQKMPAGEFRDEMLSQLKSAEVYELDGKRRVPVTVKLMTSESPDVPAVDQAEIEKYVLKKLDDIRKANPLPGNPLGAIPTMNNNSLPASVRRGQVRNFHGTEAEMKAFRWGSWALACIGGSDQAKAWCNQHGVTVAKAGHLEGTNSAGGFLVPEILENDIIDLRLQYGVFRREAYQVPMTSDLSNRPRRKGGLSASFVGEAQAGTASAKNWDNVQLSAKKLMVLARISSELSEDAIINIGDDLAGEIVYAFATKEDQCGFLGDGTSTYGGITGIVTALSNINGVDDGGGLVLGSGNAYSELTMTDFHNVVGRCPSYAREGAKWYVSPSFHDSVMWKLVTALGGITASDAVEGTRPMFLGYPVIRTETMPTTAANSQICALFGNLRQSSSFGDRRQTTIAFSTSGTVDGVEMFTSDQIAVRGTERFDIVNHDLGDSTTAGPVVGLILAAG